MGATKLRFSICLTSITRPTMTSAFGELPPDPFLSAVALGGGKGRRAPLTTACSPQFGLLRILFWSITERKDSRQ